MHDLELTIARAIKAHATNRKAKRKAISELVELSKDRASQ